jgi:hypothetical protein
MRRIQDKARHVLSILSDTARACHSPPRESDKVNSARLFQPRDKFDDGADILYRVIEPREGRVRVRRRIHFVATQSVRIAAHIEGIDRPAILCELFHDAKARQGKIQTIPIRTSHRELARQAKPLV